MKVWKVYWNYMNRSHMGFVKARDAEQAMKEAVKALNCECVVNAIHEGKEHQITPQSLTLNFHNTTRYEMFG